MQYYVLGGIALVAIILFLFLLGSGRKKLSVVSLIFSAFSILNVWLFNFTGSNEAMLTCHDASVLATQSNQTVTLSTPKDDVNLSLYGAIHLQMTPCEIEDFGNLTTATLEFGPLQLLTIVATPIQKDMPILFVNYIYLATVRKTYIETLDISQNPKNEFLNQQLTEDLNDVFDAHQSALPAMQKDAAASNEFTLADLAQNATAADDESLALLVSEVCTTYLDYSAEYPTLSEEEQEMRLAAVQTYCDNLAAQGGEFMEILLEHLGERDTKKLFDTMLLGE